MEYDASCSFCGAPAGVSCPRCGRVFCADHGVDVCSACLDPVSAAPPAGVFYGALASFAVAFVLGIALLVHAPSTGVQGAGAAPASTAAAETLTVVATPTPPFPSNTPDPGPHTYTVKKGDTLQAIAAYYGVRTSTIEQVNPSLDPTKLQIGQVIHIPATK